MNLFLRSRPRLFTFAGLLALVFAVFWIYRDTLHYGYFLDDQLNLLGNETLLSGWGVFFPPEGSGFWGRPVVNMSFAANIGLGGDLLAGIRVTNLLIHLACACLVWMTAHEAACTFGVHERGRFQLLGWGAAVLWACHPLQSQTILYLSQRTELLGSLFYLASVWSFLRGRTSGSFAPWGWISVLFAVLSVGCKEMVITLPLIVVSIEWILSGRDTAKRLAMHWRYHVGIIAVAGVVVLKYVLQFHSELAVALPSAGDGISGRLGYLGGYLRLVVWPDPLVFDYGPQWLEPWASAVGFGAIGLFLLGASLWAFVRGRAAGLLGVSFFIVIGSTLVLLAQSQPFSEHRLYLALAFPAFGVVWALAKLPRPAGFIVLVGGALLLSSLTQERLPVYQSPIFLAKDTVAKVSENRRAQLTLASAYMQDYDYEKAAAIAEALLRKDADFIDARRILGLIYRDNPARKQHAIAQFRQVVALKPDSAPDVMELANLLSSAKETLAEAESLYRRAIVLSPLAVQPRMNLGGLLAKQGRELDAEREYKEVLKLRPNWGRLYLDWADAIVVNAERRPEAKTLYERALSLDPALAQAHFKLALIASEKPGNDSVVEKHYREAISIDPKHVAALYNLGLLLYRDDARCADAEPLFRRVLEVDPTIRHAQEMIQKIQAKMERLNRAKTTLAQ